MHLSHKQVNHTQKKRVAYYAQLNKTNILIKKNNFIYETNKN
jgi:hypothetical protein